MGFTGKRLNWATRAEYRLDDGVTQAEQYLVTNRVDFRLRDSFHVLGKANVSQTTQDVARMNDGQLLFGQSASDARFVEASIGLAHRPVDHDRYNWLGMVTYLYDLASYGQENQDASAPGVFNTEQSYRTDQKSLVASLEGIYRLSRAIDLGAKVAHRSGEVRLERGGDDWIDSEANFAAIRLSYEFLSKWDAMVEYRMLDVPDAASSRTGFLLSVDREVARSFRVGVGYNFTDFSDDLTNLDYQFRGVFLNVVGKY